MNQDNSEKKNNKCYKIFPCFFHLIIFTLFIILICSLFLGILFYIARFFESPLESGYDYLGFIGSIIGGLLTLIGVYYTVQAENKRWKIENEKRDKEILDNKKILYKPIFSLRGGEIKSHIDYDKDNKFQINFVLKIFNVGRGEAYDIDLSYLPEKLHILFDDFTIIDLIANGDYISLNCLILAKDKIEVYNIANSTFDFEIKFNSAFDCDLEQILRFKLKIENLSIVDEILSKDTSSKAD